MLAHACVVTVYHFLIISLIFPAFILYMHISKTLSILLLTTRGSSAVEMSLVEESVLPFQ